MEHTLSLPSRSGVRDDGKTKFEDTCCCLMAKDETRRRWLIGWRRDYSVEAGERWEPDKSADIVAPKCRPLLYIRIVANEKAETTSSSMLGTGEKV